MCQTYIESARALPGNNPFFTVYEQFFLINLCSYIFATFSITAASVLSFELTLNKSAPLLSGNRKDFMLFN